MPRQVKAAASSSSPAPRTVAQTRASIATTRSSGRTTRGAVKKSSPFSASAQRPPAPGPAPASQPAVRQLRSRQVPLPPENPSEPHDSVNLIFVQGKRRRSRSATSSRASELETPSGSRATRGSKNTAQQRRRLLQGAPRKQPPRTQSLPRPRTTKTESLKHTKKCVEETLVVCPICQEKVPPSVLQAHTSVCNVHICPLVCENCHCQWRGTVSQTVGHIVKAHPSVHCVTGPNATIVLNNWRKAVPLHWSNLQTCLGHNFLVEVKKLEKFNKCPKFYGSVRLVGHQDDADRFEYRMMMKTRSEMKRVFSYSTMVRPLCDKSSVINKQDSFVFDSSQAEIFSYEGNLEVEVSISVMKM